MDVENVSVVVRSKGLLSREMKNGNGNEDVAMAEDAIRR